MLTGACMSRAGLNRKTGLATATLVLAAEASDLDVFYGIHGRVAALQHHRGWTHSFVAVPAMAGLAVLVVWAWNRLFRKQRLAPNLPVRWGVLYTIALLMVFLCLAALYESWSIPLSVILVVPLGVLGALLATKLRGLPLSLIHI